MPTVLIADDSPVALHLLGTSLRARGLIVIETTCAHDAALIDPFAIDAALLDLDLGDGDGATVAETFREKRPDLRLAFFSSETKGVLFSRATAIATVFSKESADAAIAWAIEATRPA